MKAIRRNNNKPEEGKKQPSLPLQHDEQVMLKDIEALAKRITAGEIQIGDAQYDLKLNELSAKYQIKVSGVKKTLMRFLPVPEPDREDEAAETSSESAINLSAEVQTAAKVLHKAADIFSAFEQDFRTIGYIADSCLARSLLMSHGARLLKKSSAFTVYGSSASGKSDAIHKAAQFLPPEVVLTITSVSEQAFYYLGDLSDKYVKLGEVKPVKSGDDDYRQEAERQLISENCITRKVVEKEGGKNVAADKVTKGPCVLISSTTIEPASWNTEYVNRRSWVRSNDDEPTTEKVIKLQATKYKEPWINTEESNQLIRLKWQVFHRNLKYHMVYIPYADLIIPTSRHVTVRRLNNLLLMYVEISALLHQGSRDILAQEGKDFLLATIADYKVAYELLKENAPRTLELISRPARNAYDKIKAKIGSGRMSTGEITALLSEPKSSVKRWIYELTDAGLLAKDTEKKNKENIYVLGVEVNTLQEIGLIEPREVEKILCASSPSQTNERKAENAYSTGANISSSQNEYSVNEPIEGQNNQMLTERSKQSEHLNVAQVECFEPNAPCLAEESEQEIFRV